MMQSFTAIIILIPILSDIEIIVWIPDIKN